MTPRRDEAGMALLTVLALVAFIAVVAATSLERLKLSTRVATNIAALDQARGYGYAAEAIALSRIVQLAGPDVPRTTLDSGLLGTDLPFPVERGLSTVRIDDGGNCFNVNSVVQGTIGQPMTIRSEGLAQIEALVILTGGEPAAARQIAGALGDWIDSDSATSPGGAEDGAYANAETPYRTANTLMADASEIRSIAGVTPELYARLRPFLCALPVNDLSPVNVNTLLPSQAPLIAMLMGGQIDVARARGMIDARPRGGYASAVDFWKLASATGAAPSATAQAQTVVKTRWFAVDLSVALAGAELRERALIDAGAHPVKLVRRIYGDPE
jgi:general secretion pathway protein K